MPPCEEDLSYERLNPALYERMARAAVAERYAPDSSWATSSAQPEPSRSWSSVLEFQQADPEPARGLDPDLSREARVSPIVAGEGIVQASELKLQRPRARRAQIWDLSLRTTPRSPKEAMWTHAPRQMRGGA